MTVSAPGSQGAVVTGTQGIGVRTPSAAAVADATSGLEGLLHIPNVGTFTIGLPSMMLAAGTELALVLLTGRTANVAGATPKVHVIMAPITTCIGIASLPGFV